MTKGILGRKIDDTSFGENGELIPVTVVEQAKTLYYKRKLKKLIWLQRNPSWI